MRPGRWCPPEERIGPQPDSALLELSATSNEAQRKGRRHERTRTIICGVDGSVGGRSAVRVAASLATQFDARLVAVHVLDRLTTGSETAERVAAAILYDEAPTLGPRRAARSAMSPSGLRLSHATRGLR